MSNTPSFVAVDFFPFCPGNINAIVGNIAFIPNISLATAMSLAWNLENFTIARTGTATRGAATADGTGTFTLNPVSDTITNTTGGGAGMWFPTTGFNTAWASWPAIKQPYQRVCYQPTDPGQLATFSYETPIISGNGMFAGIAFYIGNDPVNTGMYQFHYQFYFNSSASSGGNTAAIYFADAHTGVDGTQITTGNIAISGLNLAWVSGYDGTSYTGGTMSATSSNYTYV